MEKTNLYKKINEFLNKNLVLFLLLLLFFIVNFYNNGIISKITTKETYKTKSLNTNMRDLAAPMSINTRSISLQNEQNNRKIIRSFNLYLIVKDINSAKNAVEEELNKLSGYETNFYSYEYSDKKAINLELKVPSEKVDEYLNFVKKIGYVKSENFSSVDYTDQYEDTENKLKNLYIRRDKLREMMKNQAKQLSDVLSVDKELNNTQLEIERLEKQNNKIQKSVDYSDIHLTLEPEIIENRQNQEWNLVKVINKSIDLMFRSFYLIIEYIILLLVFLPVFVVFYGLVALIGKIYFKIKKFESRRKLDLKVKEFEDKQKNV